MKRTLMLTKSLVDNLLLNTSKETKLIERHYYQNIRKFSIESMSRLTIRRLTNQIAYGQVMMKDTKLQSILREQARP